MLITEAQAPGTSRRIDLVRIGLWNSRGRGIDAHELKVSRADWLRELDDPGKAEAWWPYCHRFWIVAPPGVVEEPELPEGWGLMLPPASSRSRRFKVAVKPATKEPEVSVALMVELIRRTDNTRLGQIEQLQSDHRRELSRVKYEMQDDASLQRMSPQVRGRLDLLEQLEEHLGVKLDSFSFGDVVQPAHLAAGMKAAVRDAAHAEKLRQRITEQLGREIDGCDRRKARLKRDLEQLQADA